MALAFLAISKLEPECTGRGYSVGEVPLAGETQRFCPLCDRPFVEAEAVLRCEGCGVLHHPACWVRNGGCVTEREHQVVPSAIAFNSGPPVAGQAPHPGEGTRRFERPGQPAVAPYVPVPPDEGEVIGEPPPPPVRAVQRPVPPPEMPPAPPPQRSPRPVPPPPEPMGPVQHGRYAVRATAEGRPLPAIYGRHQILRLWYLPVAAFLAVLVALVVIWGADQLLGGDDAPGAPPPTATSGAQPTATRGVARTPDPSPSPGATATSTGDPTAKFRPGDIVVVTGAGDCLNVRVGPARANDAIVCLQDGREMTITGGPEVADGFRWWKVRTTLGEGWAAEDFMTKKP